MEQCDYIVPISQKTSTAFLLSNRSNILLNSVMTHENAADINFLLHAKFNSDLMNGIQISGSLIRNGLNYGCTISEFKLYRVSDSGWSESFIANIPASQVSHGVFSGYINQSTLSSNELSGSECYSVSCIASRVRRKFYNKIFINHIGCYDSIVRLRSDIELLSLTKLDE